MADAGRNGGGDEISFEAFGVCMAVEANPPEILDHVKPFLPPGWSPCPPSAVERRFTIAAEDRGTYALRMDDKESGNGNLQLDLAIEMLDSELRIYLGRKAPDTIFVHAGVIAHNGTAMVMPSETFGGKTTLVAALVREGAIYYSDEFALIDREGLVHPYPRRLSVRGDGGRANHTVESLGGVAGDKAVPLGMIVITSYRPGAQWSPKRVSPGAGAMAMLANAVPAMERSEEVMRVISRAAKDAVVIDSDRGEAVQTAPLLLAELERTAG